MSSANAFNLVKALYQMTKFWHCPLKVEFFLSGILDCEETEEDDENDEILKELRAKQAELKAVCNYNIQATKKLYKLAKEEMGRQEMKRKLSAADSEVCDSGTVVSAKS